MQEEPEIREKTMNANWNKDSEMTAAARKWFHNEKTTVYTKDGHYVADKSPYGRLEMLSVGQEGFLVAVSDPPDDRRVEDYRLPDGLGAQLQERGVTPWRVIEHTDARKAMLTLATPEEHPDNGSEAPSATGQQAFSMYVRPLDEPVGLVGESRFETARQLAALIKAHTNRAPLACLAGPRGVGRRVTTSVALEMLGRTGIELPLNRMLLVDRIFQTPMELLLETLMSAQALMTENEVLVVSEAHLLAALPPMSRQQVLGELKHLPGVVLLAETCNNEMELAADIIALTCRGLDGPAEVKALLDVTYPKIVKILVPQALAAACRGACIEGFGILPARLLYIIRLSSTLVNPAGDALPVSLSPDELLPAIRMANQAWEIDDGNE
jgi:hypothetical protein